MRRLYADLGEKHEPRGTISADPEPSIGGRHYEVKLTLTNAAIEKRTFNAMPSNRVKWLMAAEQQHAV